jgi:hypothetical protein
VSVTVLSLWKGRIERDELRAAIEAIFAEVAAETGISTARMLNTECRELGVAAARRLALHRAIQETGAPITTIAQKVGVERKCVQRARDAA